MAAKPLIGITTYSEQARWSAWDEPAALIPLSYVRAVDQAGGRPLLVPPLQGSVGGADVDPAA